MSLSLIDLLSLPREQRTDFHIQLNISALKEKCDLFYYLSDWEACQILRQAMIETLDPDTPVKNTADHLTILLSGKLSLCHKVLNQSNLVAKESGEEEKEKKKEEPGQKKQEKNVQKVLSPEERRVAVINMVTNLLEQRKMMIEQAKVAATKPSSADSQRGATPEQEAVVSRTMLYGKSIMEYSEGSYFGGPAMRHQKTIPTATDLYTFVTNEPCVLLGVFHERT